VTVHKAVTVRCDICGEYEDECGYSSVTTARDIARENGWKQRRLNGATIDICDQCIEKEQASS
jgi:hypothetical protein